MESIPTLRVWARRLATVAATAALTACGSPPSASASSSPVPQPVAGDAERTTFSPSLGIHLDSMTRHASGLYVQDLASGNGAVATRGRTVVVRYSGWLPSGKQFDAGEITLTLGTNKTIPAWEEGLLGMRVNGRRRLVVPPSMGYGSKGAGEIPANSVLVFEMELLSAF
jgi:FKBP-type peptidyl-prolyl cis-trans isomerase FkpA